MGATNPANAAEGTIRKLFAESIERNSIHGSDAPETAAEELKYFFTTRNSTSFNGVRRGRVQPGERAGGIPEAHGAPCAELRGWGAARHRDARKLRD